MAKSSKAPSKKSHEEREQRARVAEVRNTGYERRMRAPAKIRAEPVPPLTAANSLEIAVLDMEVPTAVEEVERTQTEAVLSPDVSMADVPTTLPRALSPEVPYHPPATSIKGKLSLHAWAKKNAATRFGCSSSSAPEILSLAYHLGETLDLARQQEERVDAIAKDVAAMRAQISVATKSCESLNTKLVACIFDVNQTSEEQATLTSKLEDSLTQLSHLNQSVASVTAVCNNLQRWTDYQRFTSLREAVREEMSGTTAHRAPLPATQSSRAPAPPPAAGGSNGRSSPALPPPRSPSSDDEYCCMGPVGWKKDRRGLIDQGPVSCSRGCEYDDVLTIASWNLHGKLPLKIETNDLRALLAGVDILLLQETHLYKDQEYVLALPRGFTTMARGRFHSDECSRPSGGMGVIFRSHLPLQMLEQWSSADCLTLKLGPVYILCVYLPPENSPYARTQDLDSPEGNFYQAAQQIADEGAPVLVFGDFNARTACLNSFDCWPRSSEDDHPVCARGRRLLHHLREYGWFILNGCDIPARGITDQLTRTDRFTCLPVAGFSVVDYAITNTATISAIRDLKVLPKLGLSDHRALRLTIARAALKDAATGSPTQKTSSMVEPEPSVIPAKPPRVTKESSMLLNQLLRHSLESIPRSPEHALRAVYGEPHSCTQPWLIWIGSVLSSSKGDVGFGIYCPLTEGRLYGRASGCQSLEDGAAFALRIVLSSVPTEVCVTVYTSSQRVVAALSLQAYKNNQQDWRNLSNGEIVRDIAAMIRSRTAHVNFKTGMEWRTNKMTQMALGLAAIGAELKTPHMGQPDSWFAPSLVSSSRVPVLSITSSHHANEVRSSRYARSSCKVRASGLPLDDLKQQPSPVQVGYHRDRSSVRAIRMANTQALVDAPSDAHFWKAIRRMSDNKQPEAPFSSPSFSMAAMERAEDFARSLPDATEDVSEGGWACS